MGVNQEENESRIKTHEEILALFKEADQIEKGVLNARISEHTPPDIEVSPLPTVVAAEFIQETPPEEELKKPNKKQRKPKHPSIFSREKRLNGRKTPDFLESSNHPEPSSPPSAEIPEVINKPRKKKKPVTSTFTLRVTEDGSLVGLAVKKPVQQSTEKKRFLHRRNPAAQTGATSSQNVQEAGLKGKMKGVISKIIPRHSKGESSGGVAGKIKGIFKGRTNQ